MLRFLRNHLHVLSAIVASLSVSARAVAQDTTPPQSSPPAQDPGNPPDENPEDEGDLEIEVEVTPQPAPVEEPFGETSTEVPADKVSGNASPGEAASPVEPSTTTDAPAADISDPTPRGEVPKKSAADGSSALKAKPFIDSPVQASETKPLRSGLYYRRPLPRGFDISGFVQAQYQRSQLSEDEIDSDGENLNLNTIGVRRARLRLAHGWRYAFARLELDASTWGGAPVRIRRAEASLLYRGEIPDDVTPPVVFTAGVTDVPFGAELAESQLDRLFMEQSLSSRALFPSPADLGVKLWGAYDVFDYALALVNGEPSAEDGLSLDPNSAKDFSGRVGTELSPLSSWLLAAGASVYVGTGFRPGVPATKDSLQWVDINNNGVAEPSEIQGVTGSSAIPSDNYSRFAVGLDARTSVSFPIGVLQVGGELFVASNMDRGLIPHDPIVSGADSRQFGASFFATQELGKYVALGFRGAYYDPNSNLTEQRAAVFHLRNQTFWELSPVVALKIEHVRLSGQYDLILDHLGRDLSGVPTNLNNNQWTLRLQVDL